MNNPFEKSILNLNGEIKEELMDWSEYNPEWYKENDPDLYKEFFTKPQFTIYPKEYIFKSQMVE